MNSKRLDWCFHPCIENKQVTMLLGALLLGVPIIIFFSFKDLFLSFMGGVLFFFSLSRFFLPTYYTVDDKGVKIKFLGLEKHFPWERFARVDIGKKGVFLSPYFKRCFLDNYRGCELYCKKGIRPIEVAKFAKEYIKK